MSMQDDRPPTANVDPRHAASLMPITAKKDKVRYACEVIHRETGTVSRAAVSEWLTLYGVLEHPGQTRSSISTLVNDWRRDNGLSSTGEQTTITPEVIAAFDKQREQQAAKGRVVQFPDHGREGVRNTPTGQANTATEQNETVSTLSTEQPTEQGNTPAQRLNTTRQPAVSSLRVPAESAPAATPVHDERPKPSKVTIRYGWHRWAGPAALGTGTLALTALAANEVATRVLHKGVTVTGGWRAVAVAGGAAALVALVGMLLLRRAPRRQIERVLLTGPAKAWYVVFGGALLASADASFRMWHQVLGAPLLEAAIVFAVLEGAMLATSVTMRANLMRNGQPGAARTLLWLLTAFGVVSAFAVSFLPDGPGFMGGVWRSIVGPLVATLSLHMAMGVELRVTGVVKTASRFSEALRSLGQHALSFVGAGSGDQTWIVIRRERALSRAARLGSVANPTRLTLWRLRRARRACGAGVTEEGTADLLKALSAERASEALLHMSTVSPWDGHTIIEAPATARNTRRQEKAADREGRKSKADSSNSPRSNS